MGEHTAGNITATNPDGPVLFIAERDVLVGVMWRVVAVAVVVSWLQMICVVTSGLSRAVTRPAAGEQVVKCCEMKRNIKYEIFRVTRRRVPLYMRRHDVLEQTSCNYCYLSAVCLNTPTRRNLFIDHELD